MSSNFAVRETSLRSWIAAAGVVAALWSGCETAAAEHLVDPPVFASQHGVLDIMMIAKPQPIPSISFTPPRGATIHPTGWVYEICPRPASGLTCPPGSGTVSPYGGVRLALQPGDTLKVRFVNRLPKMDPVKSSTRPIRARRTSTSTRPIFIPMACSRRRGRDVQRSDLRRLHLRLDLQLGERHSGAADDAPARPDRDGYGRLQDRHSVQPSFRPVLVPPACARHRAQPGVEGMAGIITIGHVGDYVSGDYGGHAVSGHQRASPDAQGHPGDGRRHIIFGNGPQRSPTARC